MPKDTDTEDPVSHETSGVPPEQEERIVDKVVGKIKDSFHDLFPPADTHDPEQVEHEAAELPKEPTTVREIEGDLEEKVKTAVRKIGADEEHEKEHERLRAAKVEPERQPIQYGRVTRALWHPGEDS